MFIFCLCDVGYWISVKIRVHAVQKVKEAHNSFGTGFQPGESRVSLAGFLKALEKVNKHGGE